ncbi:hypothetical protein BpHYR1_004142 [Brachionus plicatilis]|uniref:Uncharacterized protein n=1 Tax=Brachionus plicatilis TaxID=10195 RepID=A0A3M7P4B5_BRAPC|nr:hypothetical protein BpHYR1_004142 [Brachionus plicatilis]
MALEDDYLKLISNFKQTGAIFYLKKANFFYSISNFVGTKQFILMDSNRVSCRSSSGKIKWSYISDDLKNCKPL